MLYPALPGAKRGDWERGVKLKQSTNILKDLKFFDRKISFYLSIFPAFSRHFRLHSE